jgi:dTDP-4-amino-4,6-dideoxygalactose transaminase
VTISLPTGPQPEARSAIPFFDGAAQSSELLSEIRFAIERVIASQRFILGPEVAAFEAEIAAYLGVQHAVGVSSGTDALTLALLASDIGPGDEVITTPYTFFATTGAILRVGATPVFADIEPDGFNLDPARVVSAMTSRTRAILPVHLFGQAADMGALRSLAEAHSLSLVEDAAQALGARYQGKLVGSLGHLACFSFFPTKNLGAFGDGGLVATNDEALAAKVRSLRSHGFAPKHHSRRVGGNYRLDALQAAVLRVKLPHLERWNALRRDHAAYYLDALADLETLTLPRALAGRGHVYNQFVVRSVQCEAIAAHLAKHGVSSQRYYPFPIHLQDACAHLGYERGAFPIAEACARECLALPIYPELEPWMLRTVVSRVREACTLA